MRAIIAIGILLIIGVWRIISSIVDSVTASARAANTEREKLRKINEKYPDRSVDRNKTLEERNEDIIQERIKVLSTTSHRSYYIENSVRDCIQEIAEAERQFPIAPNYSYLSEWQKSAPPDWLRLKDSLLVRFRAHYKQLQDTETRKRNEQEQTKCEQLKTKYTHLIGQFYEVAERKISILDDYGEEHWSALPKEIELLLRRIGTQEGRSEYEIKEWKKHSFFMPAEWKLLAQSLETGFKEYHEQQKTKKLGINDFTGMTGVDFEVYIANLLKSNGFSDVRGTPATGDQGADLITTRDGKTIIIQAKRYDGAVGNKAVQEVASAVQFYGAQEGWVITNSIFTPSAKELAQKTGVRLIDGHTLRTMFIDSTKLT